MNCLILNQITNHSEFQHGLFYRPIVYTAASFILSMSITRLVLKFADNYDVSTPRTLVKHVYRLTSDHSWIRSTALVVAILFARLFPLTSIAIAIVCGIHAGLMLDITEQQRRLNDIQSAYS